MADPLCAFSRLGGDNYFGLDPIRSVLSPIVYGNDVWMKALLNSMQKRDKEQEYSILLSLYKVKEKEEAQADIRLLEGDAEAMQPILDILEKDKKWIMQEYYRSAHIYGGSPYFLKIKFKRE